MGMTLPVLPGGSSSSSTAQLLTIFGHNFCSSKPIDSVYKSWIIKCYKSINNKASKLLYGRVYMYMYTYTHIYIYINIYIMYVLFIIYTHIYIYIYNYLLHVCIRVCYRYIQDEGGGEGGRKRCRPGKEWCPVVPLQPPWESKGKDTNI